MKKERIMKRSILKYSSIYILTAGISLSSCSDFLVIEPQNMTALEQFWNEKADVENVMKGCYSRMLSDDVLERMMVWGEFRSDNITVGRNADQNIHLTNVLKENLTASNAFTTWEGFYNVINRCNTLIKFVPQVAEHDPAFTQGDLAAAVAEASALRDLCYFYLIRTFRDVPYTTEAFIDDSQKMDLPATPFKDVLDSLINDLERVKVNATKRYPSNKPLYNTARITKETIWAMLCEMYLWKQDYAKCILYADSVINNKKKEYEATMSPTELERTNGFPLLSEYSIGYGTFGSAYNDLFITGNSQEAIFELSYANKLSTSGAANGRVPYYYGNDTEHKGVVAPSTVVMGSTAKLFTHSKDARYYESCNLKEESIAKFVDVSVSISNVATDINPSNDVDWGGAKSVNKCNWIIYRLTDIMLLKAEAIIQQMQSGADPAVLAANKPMADAAFYLINAVNKRAVCVTTSSLQKTDTLDATSYQSKEALETLVMEERQREFLFEGKRYYDLVRQAMRTGNSAEMANAISKKMTSGGDGLRMRLSKLDAIFWPYNLTELKVNKNLKQNPAFGSGENDSYSKTN